VIDWVSFYVTLDTKWVTFFPASLFGKCNKSKEHKIRKIPNYYPPPKKTKAKLKKNTQNLNIKQRVN